MTDVDKSNREVVEFGIPDYGEEVGVVNSINGHKGSLPVESIIAIATMVMMPTIKALVGRNWP